MLSELCSKSRKGSETHKAELSALRGAVVCREIRVDITIDIVKLYIKYREI